MSAVHRTVDNSPSQLDSSELTELLEMVWRGRVASALLDEGSDPERVYGLMTTAERGIEARERVLKMWHPHIAAMLHSADPIDDLIPYQQAVTALIELMATYEPEESTRPIVDIFYQAVASAVPGATPPRSSTPASTANGRGRCRNHH